MKAYTRKRRLPLFCAVLLTGLTALTPVTSQNASALANKSDWHAGRIIDDALFYNSNDMTVEQIQSFLNARVPVCDRWGVQTSEYGGGTRAQYGASRGYPAPYTCLKEYYENPTTNENNLSGRPIPAGGLSSAQLIKNAAVTYGVSVRALLVIIQKESPGPLLTDTWPFPSQFRNAMGYGCPDTAPCDPAFDGFNKQVSNAARQFKLYKNNPAGYRHKPQQVNAVLYQANAPSCGSSDVYIESFATAGLYNYTPYQPNQAALNNMYGTGDACSAYGNRNFWRMYVDWFGPTINSTLSYSLIKSSDSPAIYLQAADRKYYIPSWDVINAWGLSNMAVQEVPQNYLDSLWNGPWVSNLLMDDWNNYSLVEGGKLHYIRDPSYLSLWGLNPNEAVQSLGLAYALPSGNWVGRFVQDATQPDGALWLVDKGKKHPITDASMVYHWRYTIDQLTAVSTVFLNAIPTAAGNVTPYATTGTDSFVIDSGRKIGFDNGNIQDAYYGSSAPTTYDPLTLSFLPGETASQFAANNATGQWFMLEHGRRHYVPTGAMAEMWGKRGLTYVSSDLMNRMADAGELSNTVQTTNPIASWVVDGSKRYIPDAPTLAAWSPEGASLPTYSKESLALLPQQSNATATINATGSPYTYVMISGIKHYIASNTARSAWSESVMQTSSQLVNSIPEGAFVKYLAQDESGNGFLLMKGIKYPISNGYNSAWGINESSIRLSNTFLASYPTGPSLKGFVKIGSRSYVMSEGGSKVPINRYADAYKTSSQQEISLPEDYFSSTTEANFLIKSTDPGDQRMWLVNDGKKTQLSFVEQVSFGYLSRGLVPTALSPAIISQITDDTVTVSPLIQKQGSGIKLLNFGSALGFPDGDTLFSFVSNKGILRVSDSVYDSISLTGNVSRIITDDQGKYYLVENGQRRWISSSAAYAPYRNIPRVYLFGTTMALIPEGPSL